MEESIAGLFFVVFFLLVTAFAIAATGFWIWMLVDAIQVPADQYYKGGSKVTWVLVIALLQALGALVYLLAGRPPKETREWLKAQRAAGQPVTGAAGGPVYPQSTAGQTGGGTEHWGGAPPGGPQARDPRGPDPQDPRVEQAPTQPFGGGQPPPRLDKDARERGADGSTQS